MKCISSFLRCAVTELAVAIVDDEPLAIERLRILLADRADVTIAGTARDGESALAMIEQVRPDLVLLDIAMPDMNGIDVARALARDGISPAIVFVTAFENFAVAAFDVAAVDYLMKPVDPARLAVALDRARAHAAKDETPPEPSRYVEEFWVPEHNGLVRIAADRIDRISAERDYMRLHIGPRSWLIHRTIARLEEELDPAVFVRVHRSVILRRETITGLSRDAGGHWNARLSDGGEQRIGRSYADNVRQMTGRG